MDNEEIKIQLRGVKKSFGDHKVLDDINLDIIKGSSLVILGSSGTGKSVLIKNIIGLITPDSGSIIIDGEETFGMSYKQRLNMMQKYGFLFQSSALFDSLTIKDNITFFADKLYSLSKKDKNELAEEKLYKVGLPARVLEMYPSELSGGMQKRVALARAICTNPEVLFLDEPTTGLDPIMANVINDLIMKIREELKATTITITHDINSANIIATKIAMIYQGKILWSGDKNMVNQANNQYLYQFIHGLTTGPISFNN